MITFRRQFGHGRLFAAQQDHGQLWLVLPAEYAQDTISLEEAWSSTALLANFGYTAGRADVDAGSAGQFVTTMLRRVFSSGPARGFVWLADPTAWQRGALDDTSAPMLGMDEAGTQVQTGLSAPIVPGVRLTVANQSALTFGAAGVTVQGVVTFAGARAAQAAPPAACAVLSFDTDPGTLSFQLYLQRQSLLDAASWGFQFLYPATGGSQPAAYEWLPLASGSPADALGFDVVIDPSDPLNVLGSPPRSRLMFTGRNADGSATVLDSAYRTAQGGGVRLTPVSEPGQPQRAALVFNGGVALSDTDEQSQLAPMGDFTLSVPAGDDGSPADLLCGMQGTELIAFQPERGDRMRFTPYQPAFAPRYPFPLVSPVAAPAGAGTLLLDSVYTTSWAQVVPGDDAAPVPYVAQPKGAALYGQDNPTWAAGTGLMGWQDPADVLPPGVPFPLVPYSGLTPGPAADPGTFAAADFERQVIGATRRQLIGSAGVLRTRRPTTHGPSGAHTVATPGGQVASIDAGRWTRILLGQSLDPPRPLAFDDPSPALQQAFQTSQLFLVAVNAAELGTFLHTLGVAGWSLSANVGAGNRYDDYRNVLIVKGRKGRLFHPADPAGSLVSNPERWTQREQFAVPSGDAGGSGGSGGSGGPGDLAELVILSQWLQDYFGRAALAGGEDLARFNAIAADENWTGILVLRADISGVPDDLAGITAGITDPARFNAHHLGVEMTPLANGASGPELDGASSLFGLIDYTDPKFTPPAAGQRAQPVPPDTVTEYDFRLLSLKVLFTNSAVRSFSSYAQLTTTAWFGLPVDHMGAGGNPYAAIVLAGTLQANNGRPVYNLASTAGTTFYFNDSAVTKVEITNAAMSTRSVSGAAVSSWFGLSGFLDFTTLQAPAPDITDPNYTGPNYTDRNYTGPNDAAELVPFDLFSFGSDPDDETASRRGLAFANLGIAMTFAPKDPASRVLALDASAIRFDVATSTPRPGSLYRQFGLEVRGLVSGTADTPPAQAGYAGAVTDARLTGVDGAPWWGIDYQLTLGTPGNLAGQVGLSARLLTAWTPGSGGSGGSGRSGGSGPGYRALLGLRLPGAAGGAALISLQTVLKLSLGQIWLKRDPAQGAFLLLFSEIALKLFGLVSIPPGSTLFYLYGDPDGAGSPSGLAWYALYRKEGTGS